MLKNKSYLVAAIESKSQVGFSFGNNFNNRTEEAIENRGTFVQKLLGGLKGKD